MSRNPLRTSRSVHDGDLPGARRVLGAGLKYPAINRYGVRHDDEVAQRGRGGGLGRVYRRRTSGGRSASSLSCLASPRRPHLALTDIGASLWRRGEQLAVGANHGVPRPRRRPRFQARSSNLVASTSTCRSGGTGDWRCHGRSRGSLVPCVPDAHPGDRHGSGLLTRAPRRLKRDRALAQPPFQRCRSRALAGGASSPSVPRCRRTDHPVALGPAGARAGIMC